VDTIVSTSAEGGLPMNRECVASLVAEVPDEDVATIIGEIEMAATATAVEIPDISLPDLDDISIPELPEFSIPDLGDISIPELPEFSIPDLGDVSIPELPELSIPDLPDVSIPIPDVSLSPATLALSRDLVDCVEGDADP